MIKFRYYLLVSLGLIIVSGSVTAQSIPVDDLEKAFIPYFRSLLIEEDYKKLEAEMKSFNKWGKEAAVDLETAQKKFQKEYEELKGEEKNLKVLSDRLNRSTPNLKSRYEVERYNKKVETFNKRKERFNGKVEEFKEKEKVPAIVLDETASGIDGLLGHSFFGDLKFVIDKSNDNPVYFLPRD